MKPAVWWQCPNCSFRCRLEDDTGEEARRLLQIVRDLHGPHCPGLRGSIG